MTTVTTARQAVRFFYKDAPELLTLTDVVVARMSAAWNRTQGAAPPERLLLLMRNAEQEIETQRRAANANLPCKAGCNHCCRFQEIQISTTEAVLVVRHIETQMNADERAAAVASILASGDTGANTDTPCALLSDAGCTVYANRPLACRSYHSLSEPACNSFRRQGGRLPPVFREAVVVDAAVREVSRVFRHARTYQMNALLRRIYADPDKPARWAAGEPSDEADIAR